MVEQSSQFDVIIAGGGLSGATAAFALAKLKDHNGKPLSIAIVEPNPMTPQSTGSYDERVLALSYQSAAIFHKLALWSAIKSQATAIKEIHVSDKSHYGKARLYAQDYQINALGYVVEMNKLGKTIINYLSHCPNVTWFIPQHISQVDYLTDKAKVTLNNQQVIEGKLLLACDGAQSTVRQLANIEQSTNSYQQHAIIANVTPEFNHNHKAFERFTEHGPIAMLPLTDNRCSLVWTVTPELAEKMLSLTDTEFCSELSHSFGHWLGNITKAGQRFYYPLSLVVAKEQIRHRMALVGNASHTLHPIAGQGFNLGLRDIDCMVKLVENALKNQQDIGNFSLLMAYDQTRKTDQQQVINFTDGLVHVFSNNFLPLVIGRNVGLKALNYLSPVKALFAKRAMGQ